MMGLTERQQACLDAIKAHYERSGQMPSLEELRKTLGLGSASGAWRLLSQLERRGAIKRIPNMSRGIAFKKEICPHCGNALQESR